jgi:hypothetical protein
MQSWIIGKGAKSRSNGSPRIARKIRRWVLLVPSLASSARGSAIQKVPYVVLVVLVGRAIPARVTSVYMNGFMENSGMKQNEKPSSSIQS